MISSLYVHIPFCQNICSYCDFCKMYYQKKEILPYLRALEEELNQVYQNETIKTIYIGGGTPSCLSVEELEVLFKILEKVKKSPQVEYTIECNFDSVTKEKLELFKRVGVNRLSFGLETTHSRFEDYLGRKIDSNKAKEILSDAKKIGFQNINVDLMYAFKGETLEEVEEDIDFILSLDVSHISTYSLIIEKNTILGIQKEKEISSDLDHQMYQLICKKLKEHGYIHYEISNFAFQGAFSSHNLTYWHNQYYYGIGLGAASYLPEKRILNTRSLSKYKKGQRIIEVENLTTKDQMIYELILNLRLLEGLDLDDFYRKFHTRLEENFPYQKLVNRGMLVIEENHLKIKEDLLYVSNYILEELIYGEE